MIQHLLLLTVAAPLIVLGQPWMSLWRPLPLAMRRAVARTFVSSPLLVPVRTLVGLLVRPPIAWVAFNVNLVFWHLPGPYDLTLQNTYVHVLEHSTFLLFGIMFWAQVTACPPAPRSLSHGARIAYVAASIVPNVALSIFLAFAQHPLYGPYAQIAHRPGGISALADQQIGAGLMWTAGDLPFAIAIAVLVQQWLSEHEAMTARLGKPQEVQASEASSFPSLR